MAILSNERAGLLDAVRRAARDAILPRFRRLDPAEIQAKDGPDDLVTIADRAAETIIAEAAADLFPASSIVGEEGVADDPARLDLLSRPGACVVIDPIDGTHNYATGLAVFGTIVALVEDGETVFGLLYDPLGDDWIAAGRGEGAWFGRGGDPAARLSPPPMPADWRRAHGYLSIGHLAGALRPALLATAPRFAGLTSLRCSCHEYRMMATGGATFMIAGGNKPWDHAAGALVMAELGGRAETLRGAPYRPANRDGGVAAAPNADALAALRAMEDGPLAILAR